MVSNEGENLIFIYSLPRSGSTLLSLILGNSGMVCSPPEPWFLLRLANVKGEPTFGKAFDDEYASVATKSFFTDKAFIQSSRCFAVQAYNAYLKERGGEIFVDKTPRYYHILSFIDELFPKAKKIWLKRNPLDIAASYKSTWNIGVDVLSGKHVEPASFDFLLGLTSLQEYFEKNSPFKYEIKYENLVCFSEEKIKELCSFCGIPFETKILQYGENDNLMDLFKDSYVGDKRALQYNAIHKNSVGHWKEFLSKDEINQLVGSIGIDIIRQIGYEETAQELLSNFNVQTCSGERLENVRNNLIERFKKIEVLQNDINELHGQLIEQEKTSKERLYLINQRGGEINALNQRIKQLELMREAGGLGWFLELNKDYKPQSYIKDEKLESRGDLISVIIPVYNGEKFLETCIKSLWEQEPCGYSIETIVIDDGSTDRSLEIAEALEKASSLPMKVIRHPDGANRGVSASRNLGITHARGEWVCMLDADDAWEPSKLKVQVNYLQTNSEVVALCSYGYNINEKDEQTIGWTGGKIAGDYSQVSPPHNFRGPYTIDQLVHGCPIVNSTVIAKKQLFVDVGGYKEGMSQQCEDWLLWSQISIRNPIHEIREPLIRYRVHSASWTTRYCREDLATTVRFEYFIELLYWMFLQEDRDYWEKALSIYKYHFPFFTKPVAHFFQELNTVFGLFFDIEEVKDGWLNESAVYKLIAELTKLKNQMTLLAKLRSIPGYNLSVKIARKFKLIK